MALAAGNGGRQVDWFFYVNGILADKSATTIKLAPWRPHLVGSSRLARDRTTCRAVVGSFPEPFLHGVDGKRCPVRLECADAAQEACDIATDKLEDAGVSVVARGPDRHDRRRQRRCGSWSGRGRRSGPTSSPAGLSRARRAAASSRELSPDGAPIWRCSTPAAASSAHARTPAPA